MDQITAYKQAARQVIEYIASLIPPEDPIETQVIIDDERGHYLLFSVGWEPAIRREYSPFAHIDVKPDGKVWVQHDGTDLRIALMLADAGIPKHQIVLGYHAPYRRSALPEFAQG
ncbi:MAG: XisI protein [Bacteroidia bacterium]|nr:XisI protein [Bacteroidia bacterium]